MPVQEITHFAVEGYHEPSEKWLIINDRIKVSEYMKSATVTKETATVRARDEAERQAAGWSAGYPLRRYRAVPVRGAVW